MCASYRRILSDSHVICSECDGFWGGLSNKSAHPLTAYTQQTEGAGHILHRIRKRRSLPHCLLFKPSSLLIFLLPHCLIFKSSSLLILLLPHRLIFKPVHYSLFYCFIVCFQTQFITHFLTFVFLLESKRANRKNKNKKQLGLPYNNGRMAQLTKKLD